MRELERQGFEVTYLDVQADGLIDMDVLKAAIRKDTILISVMFVNNEIGVIQDIPAIGACAEKKASSSMSMQHRLLAKLRLTCKPCPSI